MATYSHVYKSWIKFVELIDPFLLLPLECFPENYEVRGFRFAYKYKICIKLRFSLPTLWASWNSQDVFRIGGVPSIQKLQPKSTEEGRPLCPLSWNGGPETHFTSISWHLSFREPDCFLLFYLWPNCFLCLECSPACIPFLLIEI